MTLRGRKTCTLVRGCGPFCVSARPPLPRVPPHSMALSVGKQVAEAQAVGQFHQRLPVLMVGPDPAFSPTPYGMAIGLQAAGDRRPRQARLLLEPLQPLREVVGSSAVVCALSRHSISAPRSSDGGPLLCGRRDPIPVSLIPREVRGPVGAPSSPVHTCLLLLIPRYWPGPLTVSSSGSDSILPSSVQMAPPASQSVVAFRAMATAALESGVTVISQRMFLPGSSRRT